MMNYMKSERYRIMRKKSLMLTSIIACSLIVAAALILDFFGRNEVGFPYASSLFFYSNVMGGSLFIFIILLIVNSALTGKDQQLIKQSISFGISRPTIFWSKFLITFAYFLVLCLIGMGLMIGLGEGLFPKDDQALKSFLLGSINMFPIVMSAFILVHVMKMMRIDTSYVFMGVIFFYTLSDKVLGLLFRKIEAFSHLYKWTPSAMLNDNMMAYYEETMKFEWTYWMVGIGLSVFFFVIGMMFFNKKDID